ncbi:MAG TPA: hypothetical protein VLM83_09610 [Anaerolineales bacterium]|nr:hypothetical protein [Anaerolineales bacterium]
MAGFAILIAPDSLPQTLERDFNNFLHLTAGFKQLEIPSVDARGKDCIAAKLDSPASIHPGIVRDEQTGSWLLATGTVVALEGDNQPASVLSRLLRDYVESGVKVLEAFDGHFALVIYNGRDNCLSVISDAIGLFSIFYCQRGNQLFVSSSALAIAVQTQSQPNTLAVEHFLRTGRLDADVTLWQGVRRLLGGRVLCVDHGRIEQTEYWSPTFDASISHLPFDEALTQASDLLTNTFSRISQRGKKIWVDLTGGFDSRLAANFVAKNKIPFTAYCMGPQDHLDVQLSQKVSEEMGWEYIHTQLPEVWEPDLYSWFNVALSCGDGRATALRFGVTLRGFEERNSIIKTNVMGVGGESWRGYAWQIEKGNIGKTSKLNYEALLDFIFSRPFPLGVMRFDRTREVRQELYDFIFQLCSKYSEMPNTVQIDRFEISRDSGHGGAFLSAVTRLSRSLAPLSFKAPINFAFSLNYRWKFPRQHRFVRALLEQENKRLANLETTTGGPATPIRLTNLHKFWPLWKELTNWAVANGSQKLLGKTLQVMPQPQTSEYPLPTWRTAFHTYARSEGMLCYDTMNSKGLYKPDEFCAYIESAAPEQQHGGEFLDRVISIEMALRAVGSRID